MKIYLSPQVNEDEKIVYKFNGNQVLITLEGLTETFDFTNVPNGILEFEDEDGNLLIDTRLRFLPIISAEKKNGILYLELLNWISGDASYEERFPEWIDAEDYLPPKTNKEE